MAHLGKRNGHLVKNTDGHLAFDCCESTPDQYWWCMSDGSCIQAETEPAGATGGPYNTEADCNNNCDPTPPPTKYYCVDRMGYSPPQCSMLSLPGCAGSTTPIAGAISGPYDTQAQCQAACNYSSLVRNSYTVSLSGFPSVCSADNFNGTWTVTWSSDCFWFYDINIGQRVSLSVTAGGFWTVGWSIAGAGGGYFGGTGGPIHADPTTKIWVSQHCWAPFCPGLCPTSATAIVS